MFIIKLLSLNLILLLTVSSYTRAQTEIYNLSMRATTLMGTNSLQHGPNCFNAALIGSGSMDRVRHTSSLELSAVLNSKMCKEIKVGHQQNGDIQVFVRQLPGLKLSDQFAHANIWLNDQVSFNKMNQYKATDYNIYSNEQVLENYQFTPDSVIFYNTAELGNQRIQCPYKTLCENKIKYFRCHGSISDYIYKNTEDDFLISVFEKIQSIEGRLEIMLFSPAKDYSLLKTESEEIRELLRNKTYSSNTDLFVLEYLVEMNGSLLDQFGYK